MALIGIVGLALGLRLAGLGDRLSDAEGYSWLVASADSFGQFFDRLAAYENTPPLFYALLSPLPLDDEVWIRLPALIAGVLCVPALYCLVRLLLGTRVALLAALGLAVAPFHVSYSNYSRGFMLAGLGLLVAAWGVARLAQGGDGRWWWLYAAGGLLALHSEYYSALFLAPLLGVLVVARTRRLWEVALVGILPALTLLPLVGEVNDGLDQLDVTKVSPVFPEPSAASLRDTLVSLFFGEHGTAASGGTRALQFIALVAALGVSATWLHRGSMRLGEVDAESRRLAILVLAAVPATAFVLHAIVAFPGPDIFEARYLTGLIPFAAALLAVGVAALHWRWAAPAAVVVLLGLSVGVFAKRDGRELEPDWAQAGEIARQGDARLVLTNSGVVAYYLRDQWVTVDRPFGLGEGLEQACRGECPTYAVVDDSRIGGGARSGPGERSAVGPIEVRILRQPPGQQRTRSSPSK